MSNICKFCWVPLKTEKMLNIHLQKEDSDCKKWKNIVFFCQCCNFVTKGYKQINNHMKQCKIDDSSMYSNPITKLNEKYIAIKDENKII